MAKKDKAEQPTPKRHNPLRWMFPLSIAAAGLSSAATILLRGCWHTKMSWPTRVSAAEGGQQDDISYSYQVCTRCGIKRLFDEQNFRGYGPFGYDVRQLIEHDRAVRLKRTRKQQEKLATEVARQRRSV
jgi:hypothetical protein